MNLNYCIYKATNNNSWTNVVDEAFDFNLDGDANFSNTKCIINTNRLCDIQVFIPEFIIPNNIIKCTLFFVDNESYDRFIAYDTFNRLKAIIRNRKIKELINK